jgi:hypothetical protein
MNIFVASSVTKLSTFTVLEEFLGWGKAMPRIRNPEDLHWILSYIIKAQTLESIATSLERWFPHREKEVITVAAFTGCFMCQALNWALCICL